MGRHIYDRTTTYDQVKHLARFTLPDYDETGKLTDIIVQRVKIVPGTQDILSTLYYMRTRQLEEGQILRIDINERRSNYQLRLCLAGKEEIKTPAGDFLAWKLEPLVFQGRKIKRRIKGNIWLSADERKIPVKVQGKTRVGSFTLYLEEMKLF
jgi:hypothetical protein